MSKKKLHINRICHGNLKRDETHDCVPHKLVLVNNQAGSTATQVACRGSGEIGQLSIWAGAVMQKLSVFGEKAKCDHWTNVATERGTDGLTNLALEPRARD